MEQKRKTKEDYCEYCKKNTKHEISNNMLTCKECGSQRMDKIQGMNAALM